MNYCYNCGSKISEYDVYCPFCGTKIEKEVEDKKKSGRKANKVFKLIAKITAAVEFGLAAYVLSIIALELSILGLVAYGLLALVPLIWMLPLMLSVYRKINNNEYMSKAYKICVLIFLSIPTGVMLLLIKDE